VKEKESVEKQTDVNARLQYVSGPLSKHKVPAVRAYAQAVSVLSSPKKSTTAPAATQQRPSFIANLFACTSTPVTDSDQPPQPQPQQQNVQTVLINKEGHVQWTTSDTAKDIAANKAAYVLAPATDKMPPYLVSVPKVDDESPFFMFNDLKAMALVYNLFINQHFSGLSKPATSIGEYGTPPLAAWEHDDYFTQQRTLGVNPCALSLATDHVKALFPADVFADDGHKYYAVDYKILVPYAQQLAQAKAPKYIPASVCVFKYKDGKLAPVAILLDQSVPKEQHLVVVNDGTESPQWRYAKLAVRVADWNVHELGSHLTLTHYVSEISAVLTHHCLPEAHPVFQLLMPHSFRTLPINSNARAVLNPTIVANRLTAFSLPQIDSFTATCLKQWSFQGHYPLHDLKARGVEDLPPSIYVYATTATETWKLTRAYVDQVLAAVVQLEGGNDKALLEKDVYLQDWIKQMQTHMPGFPAKIDSIDELADALTMIIFTASHQHAAVNYFQKKYMFFVPSSPGYLNQPLVADAAALDKVDEKVLLANLPEPQYAAVQSALVDMLAYPPTEEHTLAHFEFGGDSSPHYVKWVHLAEAIKPFQAELEKTLGAFAPDEKVSTTNLAQSIMQ